jgi:hypothetical protein
MVLVLAPQALVLPASARPLLSAGTLLLTLLLPPLEVTARWHQCFDAASCCCSRQGETSSGSRFDCVAARFVLQGYTSWQALP